VISNLLLRRAYEIIGALIELHGHQTPLNIKDAAVKLLSEIYIFMNRQEK
jgi:hypothetical protein